MQVDPFRKHCLLNGLDDIGLTLQAADDIRAYERKPSSRVRGFLPKFRHKFAEIVIASLPKLLLTSAHNNFYILYLTGEVGREQ